MKPKLPITNDSMIKMILNGFHGGFSKLNFPITFSLFSIGFGFLSFSMEKNIFARTTLSQPTQEINGEYLAMVRIPAAFLKFY